MDQRRQASVAVEAGSEVAHRAAPRAAMFPGYHLHYPSCRHSSRAMRSLIGALRYSAKRPVSRENTDRRSYNRKELQEGRVERAMGIEPTSLAWEAKVIAIIRRPREAAILCAIRLRAQGGYAGSSRQTASVRLPGATHSVSPRR